MGRLLTDLARVVRAGHAAAVLPDIAAVDFDPKQIRQEGIPELKTRRLVLIANAWNLDRAGRYPKCGELLSERFKLGKDEVLTPSDNKGR